MSKPKSLKSLSKSAMRVLIAKDVRKWLRLRKLKARSGVYVHLGSGDVVAGRYGGDAREMLNLPNREKACYVCARGALFLAAVDRFDACEVDAFSSLNLRLQSGAGFGAGLEQFFTPTQFLLIEDAFESRNGDWRKAIHDANDRLDAICRNIIANNGRFVISDIPKPRRAAR